MIKRHVSNESAVSGSTNQHLCYIIREMLGTSAAFGESEIFLSRPTSCSVPVASERRCTLPATPGIRRCFPPPYAHQTPQGTLHCSSQKQRTLVRVPG